MLWLRLLFIVIAVLIFYIPFYFTHGFRKNKISKYIPSLICALIVAVFAIKLFYFQGSIFDIAIITWFSVFFLIYFSLTLLYISTFKRH